jgi:phospholipid/cholesterol/gamma-HCH transport system substrate-binding protein
METKANYVAVGLFTLLLTLAGFGFVYWTSGIGARGEIVQLRVRIPGSAAGLGRGSAVLFNGVKVGDVRRVYIDVTSPTLAIAETEIDRLTPITSSTRADIGLAGLTGQANIELKGGDPSEPSLIDLADAQGKVAEITANPSAVTNLLQTAQDIFARADSVLSTLEGFATDVRGPLTETATHINTFSAALGRNADGIDKFLANFGELSESLGAASGRLDSTLAAAEELIRAVDREKVGTIVSQVETFTARLESASTDFEGIMRNVDQAVASVRDLSAGAGETLGKVDGLIDGMKTGVDTAVASIGQVAGNASGTLARVDTILESVKPERVESALANIEGATQDARSAAADVAALADRFGNRADDIDKIITDARGIAEKLNQASSRVDGVLVKVDNLLGSGEAEGVMAEANETLKAFRQVADTLNARMGTITDGLARFSGQGLREVEALITDSRRSINRIEQAISSFERNPQRILSGGDGGVRQYDGRARR